MWDLVLVFGLGFLGSFGHCVGMCGPITVALALSQQAGTVNKSVGKNEKHDNVQVQLPNCKSQSCHDTPSPPLAPDTIHTTSLNTVSATAPAAPASLAPRLPCSPASSRLPLATNSFPSPPQSRTAPKLCFGWGDHWSHRLSLSGRRSGSRSGQWASTRNHHFYRTFADMVWGGPN